MTSSGGAQLAPSGFAGALPSSIPFSGTNIKNAMNLPSRDQDNPLGESVKSAIREDAQVENQCTNSCARPGADTETYASRVPSRDQVVEKSDIPSLGNGVLTFDSTSISQMDCRSRSVILSYAPRT